MEQGAELNAGLLADRPLHPRHLARVVFLPCDQAAEPEPGQPALVERDEMPTECGRGDVVGHKRGDAVQAFEHLHAMGERVFAGMLQ